MKLPTTRPTEQREIDELIRKMFWCDLWSAVGSALTVLGLVWLVCLFTR